MRLKTPRQGQRKGQAKPSRRRLGLGAFVPLDAPNPFAQMQYLLAVSKCVPEALEELRTHVTNKEEFGAWAKRRGFSDPWVLDSVRGHLLFWREQPELWGRWLIVTVAAWEPIPPPAPEWNPMIESEAAYRLRHESYVAAVKALPGMSKTPEKQSGDRAFERLALFQVGGVSLADLATNNDGADALDISTISKSLSETAKLVGLTLRQGRRGPHRKNLVLEQRSPAQ